MNKKHYFETKNSIYSYTMKDAIIIGCFYGFVVGLLSLLILL